MTTTASTVPTWINTVSCHRSVSQCRQAQYRREADKGQPVPSWPVQPVDSLRRACNSAARHDAFPLWLAPGP